MTLKINYLDRQKDLSKNMALFLGKDAKISDFKGIFDDKINQKVLKFLKQNQKITKNKISSLNLEFDQKLIIIQLNVTNININFIFLIVLKLYAGGPRARSVRGVLRCSFVFFRLHV